MTVNSSLASPKATLDKLAQWDITINKSLGQHFLIDDGVVGRILRLATPEEDELILEVGPGIGTLTEALLQQGFQVLALEKDHRLLPLLADLQRRYPDTFQFMHIDAKDYTAPQQTEPGAGTQGAHRSPQSGLPFKMVANLPYAVAATIVLGYFQAIPAMASATVMVQKEVAVRMAAESGSRDYGAYSVKLQLLAEPRGSFDVSRTCFLPAPRVDSTVIRFDRRVDQITQSEIPTTFMLIEAAFTQRRKTIRNSMRAFFEKQGMDPGILDDLLREAGISPTVRGECLTPKDFLLLGRLFERMQDSA
ncbi:MAG: 16S rRNA (adenine(1518)-N(6)/adenine(1519)-N(6))-dimethyltransferase RsmA [Coriobacteriia bacterium]|nr:16S rRNA (adenine(1518)-N(6)/adenine(1519)-N(6))-dimethyltransferase RsmA [Coriobacteriia bacterium]